MTLAAAVLAAPLMAAPAHSQYNETIRRTLLGILKSDNLPCGRVTAYERRGGFDFQVTCSQGQRYRIWRDASGVRVELVR